jgi:prepilin-type processing-associated H-X9-DG protein
MAHCEDGLKKIWRAIRDYQKENSGQGPARLEDFLETKALTVWDLVCPTSADSVGQCSYVYRGCDLEQGAPAKMIMAYDKEPLHKGRRNILFADGRVGRPKETIFLKAIEEDNRYREQFGLETKLVGML